MPPVAVQATAASTRNMSFPSRNSARHPRRTNPSMRVCVRASVAARAAAKAGYICQLFQTQ
eukprot:338209-Chlamydomonas_euryale.AAC.1